MPDDPADLLSPIRERAKAAAELNVDLFAKFISADTKSIAAWIAVSALDVPPLLAAVEAALKSHVEAVLYEWPEPPFRYCKTCSGHPAWPCPEVAAITAALAEGERS